jgi:tetratricopeptide (TPR) repeat protein
MADPKVAIFDPYLAGLRRFRKELRNHSLALLPFNTLEQRLTENIRFSENLGETETLKADRSAIIYELNALSHEVLGASFNDLCDIHSLGDGVLAATQGVNGLASDISNTGFHGWAKNFTIAAQYPSKVRQFLSHVGRNEYEDAEHIYWELIYFLGTRELWNDCRLFARKMIDMSLKEGDVRTAGLVIVTGRVWPQLEQRRLSRAKSTLTAALPYILEARYRSDRAVFHEYMAEIEEAQGDLAVSVSHYREAIALTDAAGEGKLRLKMMFAEAKTDPVSSRSRMIALHLLADEFQRVNSYREGLVLIEIARTLHILKSIEALETAQRAYSLFEEKIMMPSNANVAHKLLKEISARHSHGG